VVGVLHGYQDNAAWKAQFKTALAMQNADLAKVNTDLNPASTSALLTQSGSGTASTPRFTVPSAAGGWRLAWSYNCTAFGSSGNFQIYITGGSGADIGVNQLGMKVSGVEHYYDTGTFSLEVNSECSWAIQAVAGADSNEEAPYRRRRSPMPGPTDPSDQSRLGLLGPKRRRDARPVGCVVDAEGALNELSQDGSAGNEGAFRL
jgi:hypothetical protein